ncbi:MAG: hypothetical protein ACT4R6_13305, partial [Gemmatimonadaceae bacterium]
AAPSGPCVVPIDDAETRVRVSDASRRACVVVARLLEAQPPTITHEALLAGPANGSPFSFEEDVYCRLKPRAKQGGSLKFRCLRTNAENQLYDEDGDLVPNAADFDADDHLLDANSSKILNENGKPRKGDELRVKYFTGAYPDGRYREMFTETVVSNLFWALGVPVDNVYLPASVRCFGCAADPFGQMVPQKSSTPQIFPLASIKRPLEGRKISVPRRSGFLGLGGRYDHGFGFDEIDDLVSSAAQSRRVEVEVHALALNLVAYNNTHAYQNDLVCSKDEWDKETGECRDVVAYVSDVGGTLGGAQAFVVSGEDPPDMLHHPRGEFMTFSRGSVFDDRENCTLYYRIGGVRRVTEAARQVMDERIRGRLSHEALRIIFEKASIHRMEKRVTDRVAAQYKLQEGPELARAVQRLWADEMQRRLQEVLTARCPS